VIVTGTTVDGIPIERRCAEPSGEENKPAEKLNVVEIGSVIIHTQSTTTVARVSVFDRLQGLIH